MSNTTPTDHAAEIRIKADAIADTLWGLRVSGLVIPDVDAILAYVTRLDAQRAEAERQRDWHREDAAMARRDHRAEVDRLTRKLGEAEARAGLEDRAVVTDTRYFTLPDGVSPESMIHSGGGYASLETVHRLLEDFARMDGRSRRMYRRVTYIVPDDGDLDTGGAT